MASVDVRSLAEDILGKEPVQHDDQVECRSFTGEKGSEAEEGPNSKGFHDHLKNIREAYDSLKNAVLASTKALEKSFFQLKVKEERFNEISRKISSINFESAIRLNVGGSIYQTSLETLVKEPGSLLAQMFSTSFNLKRDSDGCYFIDRDGTHFRHILNYLRSGNSPVTSILKANSEEILNEAEYYGLVGLVKAIQAKLTKDDLNTVENVREEIENAGSSLIDGTRKELCATEKKLNLFLNLLDSNLKDLEEATQHHKKISMKLSSVHFCDNIKIDVGGKIFKISLKTMRSEPESALALMFSEKFELKKEDDGSFFIDRDGTFFHHILNYLRDGTVSQCVLEQYQPQILKEAEFYELSGLKEEIDNYNHVKLNVGGRDFVVTREVLMQYPESMFGMMLAGKECAYEKRQDGSFYIEGDDTNFHHILCYLYDGYISDDAVEECGESLLDEARFICCQV